MNTEIISPKPLIEVNIQDDPSRLFTKLKELPNIRLEPQPYMLVRPTGMYFLEQIKQLLSNEGMPIQTELKINDFETLARYLYPINPEEEASYLWLMLIRALTKRNDSRALVMDNASLTSYDKFFNFKYKIRDIMGGNSPYIANYKGRKIETSLHHIHIPDEKDLDKEFNTLMHFVEEP